MRISVDIVLSKSKKLIESAAFSIKNKYEFLGTKLRKTEGADKFGKIIVNALDVLAIAFSQYPPLGLLRGRVKNLREFIGSLATLHRIKDWICPKKGNQRFWQLEETTPLSVVSKAWLTGAQAIESACFLDAVKIISFAGIASQLGKIPFLGFVSTSSLPFASLAKDAFYFFSSLFGLVDHYRHILRFNSEARRYEARKQKWQDRAAEWKNSFDENPDGNGTKVREGLKAFYQAKIDTAELQRQELIWECLSLQEGVQQSFNKSHIAKSAQNDPDKLMEEMKKHLGEIKGMISGYQKKQGTPLESRAFLEISQKMETIIEGMACLERMSRTHEVKTEELYKVREDFNAIRVDMYQLNTLVYTQAALKPSAAEGGGSQAILFEKKYQERLNQFLMLEHNIEKWNIYISEISQGKKTSCNEYTKYCADFKARKWEIKKEHAEWRRKKDWHKVADLCTKLALSILGLTLGLTGWKGPIIEALQLVLGTIATYTSIKLFAVNEEDQQFLEPQKNQLSFLPQMAETLASAHNIAGHVDNGAPSEFVATLNLKQDVKTSAGLLKTAKNIDVITPKGIPSTKSQKVAATLAEYLAKLKGKFQFTQAAGAAANMGVNLASKAFTAKNTSSDAGMIV